MLSADEETGIVLETKRREKIGKKKQVVVKQHKLDFKQIDQTKIVIYLIIENGCKKSD